MYFCYSYLHHVYNRVPCGLLEKKFTRKILQRGLLMREKLLLQSLARARCSAFARGALELNNYVIRFLFNKVFKRNHQQQP